MDQFKSLNEDIDESKIKYIFVDFSEEDNYIEILKQKNPTLTNLYTGPEFIEKTGYDIEKIIISSLNIYNNVYNINISLDEINQIKNNFLEYMQNIKNEVITEEDTKTKAGTYFSDLYTNKFTNFMKENDKKLLVKFIFDTNKTFFAFNECLYKIIDTITNKLSEDFYIFCFRI
jgi:hypothetical protein